MSICSVLKEEAPLPFLFFLIYQIMFLRNCLLERFSYQHYINELSSGDKSSRDWDKAWSNFKKQGKKTLFSRFSPNKYVTWNPRPSNYPLSEEVDPIKRTERSNLRLWTSPGFTLVGAILIVTFLLIYTILAPVK